MLTPALKHAVEAVLSGKTGMPETIIHFKPVGGGSINKAVFVHTAKGTWFVKWNDARKYQGMFETEVLGLRLLNETGTVAVPDVIGNGEAGETTYLILQAVIAGRRAKDYSEHLGRQLAVLHRCSSETFGLDHDNYIGSLPQQNKRHKSGIDFLIQERLAPQLELALKKGYFSHIESDAFDLLYKQLPALLPNEPSSLLHGDLWNGNVITGPDGNGWLIDPAVYYGHRETDLAMARLFGGFDDSFYSSYNESFPLVSGWEDRVELFQLYPLLVHVNLFGMGYVEGVRRVLKHYR